MKLTDDEIIAARSYLIQAGAPIFWDVAHGICDEVGIKVADLSGPGRKATICRARELVCYFAAKRGVGVTLMGRLLNRDHATIGHAIRNAEKVLGKLGEGGRI